MEEDEMLEKILENLDKEDRFQIFEKFKEDLRNILAKSSFRDLQQRKTHLSNSSILILIYLNEEDAINFLVQLLNQKIGFLKDSIDYLQNNKQKIIEEVKKIIESSGNEKFKIYKQVKEYEQQQ